MRLLITVNNTKLYPIWHSVLDTADSAYWSFFAVVSGGGVTLFNTLEPLNSGLQNLTPKKLETSLVSCKKYFDILNRLDVAHECDRRTDGRLEDWWPLAIERSNIVRRTLTIC